MSAAKPSIPNSAQSRREIEPLTRPVPDVGLEPTPALHPARPGVERAAEDRERCPAPNATGDLEAPLGVYVHFPWCGSKCPYCDFVSTPTPRIPGEVYAESVLAELRRRSASLANRTVTTIYIGGGTPSLWEPRAVGRVLDAIHRLLRVADPCEISVEANPSSLDPGRARDLAAVGVNRLSIGVQSLRAERLGFLGRHHDPAQARNAVRSALDAGVRRVSVDLIFGLPNQPPDEVASDAGTLVDLGAEHVSVYALSIEPETPFGARVRQGTLTPSDEEEVANAFSSIRAELTGRGLEHYEISNYALPGSRSRHNVGYWIGLDYLGLGCAAWGTITGSNRAIRYRNAPSPREYLRCASAWEKTDLLKAGSGLPQSELEELGPETRLLERIMLGLRLSDGINVEEAARKLGVPPWSDRAADRYQRLLRDGSLEQVEGRTRIAPSRWFIANEIIAQLI